MTMPPESASTGDGEAEFAAEGALEWLVLGPDEDLELRTGPRIQTVYAWVGLAIVATAVLLAAVALEVLPPLGLLGIPVVVAPAGWQYARVARTEFVVTTRRVAVRRGVLGVSVRTVGLERIQNTRWSQGAIGRWRGYGTVAIETAGGEGLAFWNVENPESIRSTLEARRKRRRDRREREGDDANAPGRSSAVPGSVERWEAVLEEVRGWRRAVDRSRSE